MNKKTSGALVDSTVYKLSTKVVADIQPDLPFQDKVLLGSCFFERYTPEGDVFITLWDLLDEEDPAQFIPFACITDYQGEYNHVSKDKSMSRVETLINFDCDALISLIPDKEDINLGVIPLDEVGLKSGIVLGSLLNLRMSEFGFQTDEIDDVNCSGVYYNIVLRDSNFCRVLGCRWSVSNSDVRIVSDPSINFTGHCSDIMKFISECNQNLIHSRNLEGISLDESWDGFDPADD